VLKALPIWVPNLLRLFWFQGQVGRIQASFAINTSLPQRTRLLATIRPLETQVSVATFKSLFDALLDDNVDCGDLGKTLEKHSILRKGDLTFQPDCNPCYMQAAVVGDPAQRRLQAKAESQAWSQEIDPYLAKCGVEVALDQLLDRFDACDSSILDLSDREVLGLLGVEV